MVSNIKKRTKAIGKTGSRGEYLGPKGMRMGSREGYTMKNFLVCAILLI